LNASRKVRRLAGIVEFSAQGIAELSNQASCIVFFQHRKARRPLIEQACQYLKINLHEFVDAGLAHFDDHLSTIEKSCDVHLGDRSTRQRRLVKEGEYPLGRGSQIFLNDVGNNVFGQRRNLILKLCEFCAIDFGKQVGARRKHLAQLDEHGPKFLARAAKMLGARPIAGFVFEELIIGDSDAVTREDGQDFAVALAFRYHGASNRITSNI
jgi:hypothetical protein